jgi:glucose/arabinose dehydrogenase
MHTKLHTKRFVRAITPLVAMLLLSLACIPSSARAQVRAEDYPPPKPAFPGQTNAPAPSKPSPALKIDVIISGFSGAWSLAFLPNGKMLVAERHGYIHVAEMNGFYSAPIEGMPDQKQVAAESLHDVVIDPDFAHNRMIYFTYFAPPPGETPGSWPLQYFYANVWKASVAERRTMRIGEERVARARLSDDERRLENVEPLVDGVNRRIVFAADGTLFITGADRFRFYDASYDSSDHETTDPDILRNFTGRVVHIN